MKRNVLVVLISLFTILFSTMTMAAALPKFTCTLTDKMNGQKPGDAKDSFTASTPMFYYICSSDGVTKGQTVKAVWIATDTNGAAPANYKIDEKGLMVDKNLKADEEWTGSFTLSIPNKGWPKGQYRVELYVDNQLLQSAKFSVM